MCAMELVANDDVFQDAKSVVEEITHREKKRKPNSGHEEVTELTEIKNEMKGLRDSVDKMFSMIEKVFSKMEMFEERFVAVEKKIEDQSGDTEVLRQGLVKMEERVLEMEDKLIEQEAYSRRQNLVFHGLKETPGEDCFKIIDDVIKKECRIKENVVIERAHRLGKPRGKPRSGNQTTPPRPLIVRFLDYNDRERVRAARRRLPKDVKVSQDFPWQIRQARGSLNSALEEARKTSKDAWISYPARLIVDGKEVDAIKPSSMKRMPRRHTNSQGRDGSGNRGKGQQNKV